MQGVEVGDQLAGVLVALGGVFGEQLSDERFERGGNIMVESADQRWVVSQDLVDHGGQRLAGEGQRCRQRLVQHDPERKQVGAGVHRFSQGLLRRHVRDGSHHHAHLGLSHRCLVGVGGTGELREPEIEDLDLTPI